MSNPRYDPDARADYLMHFDVHGVPIAPMNLFDTESWPLCYQYAGEE
jgi:tyrosinase